MERAGPRPPRIPGPQPISVPQPTKCSLTRRANGTRKVLTWALPILPSAPLAPRPRRSWCRGHRL